ncbi:MAG TPA: FAD-binding protein [Candidatus Mediterraneibacter norfolkensis]|nr:FAD-binding protein [Candidatus Mediterraneibacter norfolkensis]
MIRKMLVTGKKKIRCICCQAVVVGSGASGLAAADQLWRRGIKDTVIVTEHVNCGTSRNAGSDKQTYYKLSLCGEQPDSIYKMARTLFDGESMDGDLALAEAAGSIEAFLDLAHAGVPFPKNRYGEFVGYKTDHDPMSRASSAGPLTSRIMTEVLQHRVEEAGIQIFSGYLVVRLLHAGGGVKGILCLRTDSVGTEEEICAFLAENIIYATGGPAGIYRDSVYPKGQHGASGIAFLAGVKGRNLTEWQYGIASVRPRWNVSGTYMQVIPRLVSTEEDGSGEQEFLDKYFLSREEALYSLFLKGYQWPFDARKVENGSSRIDMAVYQETEVRGRKVFMDFRNNPWNREISSWTIPEEMRRYLENADAIFGTPVERLCHMNFPAYEFYQRRGIDLRKEPLEVSLCAQHNNGGLAVNLWWETEMEGFFVSGEAAGTHGVYRPGGAALNAGQVGARRAAIFIAEKRKEIHMEDLPEQCFEQIGKVLDIIEALKEGRGEKTAEEWTAIFQENMSRSAGPVRDMKEIGRLKSLTEELLKGFSKKVRIGSGGIKGVFMLEDMLLSQRMYLTAMQDYIRHGGKSRGAALYLNNGTEEKREGLANMVQEMKMTEQGKIESFWREVHPIPQEDNFFENIWKGYRKNHNVF